MMEGKFKAKPSQEALTMAEVYVHQKNYIQWVRSHIGQGSGIGMRALKLYVELRDHNKTRRIQQEREANANNPTPIQAPVNPQGLATMMRPPPSSPAASEWSRVSTPRGRVEMADGRVFSWEERAVPTAPMGYMNRARRSNPPDSVGAGTKDHARRRHGDRGDERAGCGRMELPDPWSDGARGGESSGLSHQCDGAPSATPWPRDGECNDGQDVESRHTFSRGGGKQLRELANEDLKKESDISFSEAGKPMNRKTRRKLRGMQER